MNSSQILNSTKFSASTLDKVAQKKTEKGRMIQLGTYQAFKEMFPDSNAVFLRAFEVMRCKALDKCSCGYPISKYYEKTNTYQVRCTICKRVVSPLASTPLARAHFPLDKILEVAYLSFQSKHGTTACEIKRLYGIKYESALNIRHRVLVWMGLVTGAFSFSNCEIEVDEVYPKIPSYLPKEVKLSRGAGSERTQPVLTMVQRGGKAKGQVIAEASTDYIIPYIQEHVSRGNTIVHTDGKPLYRYISSDGYEHRESNHSKKEWSINGSHTNTVEALNGLIKHKVGPLHKGVSLAHLQKYIDESCFLFSYKNPIEAINALFDVLPALNSHVKLVPNPAILNH